MNSDVVTIDIDWLMGIIGLLGVLSGAFWWTHKTLRRFKNLEERVLAHDLELNESLEALKLGMRAQLRNSIYNNYTEANRKGYCSQNRRNNMGDMYNQYHELGGNGNITDIMNKLYDLPMAPTPIETQ